MDTTIGVNVSDCLRLKKIIISIFLAFNIICCMYFQITMENFDDMENVGDNKFMKIEQTFY